MNNFIIILLTSIVFNFSEDRQYYGHSQVQSFSNFIDVKWNLKFEINGSFLFNITSFNSKFNKQTSAKYIGSWTDTGDTIVLRLYNPNFSFNSEIKLQLIDERLYFLNGTLNSINADYKIDFLSKNEFEMMAPVVYR